MSIVRILYQDTVIHIPRNIGTLKGPFSSTQARLPGVGKHLLLLREPLSWLLGYYLKEETPLTFKKWFSVFPPPPQHSICPHPDAVIRSEYFPKDLMTETGLVGTINLNLLADADVCPATRTEILRKYKGDYKLGDYLAEF